jgi:hypothetical protein
LVFYLPRADPFSQGGEPIAISSELPLQRAVNAFAVAIANRQSDLSSLDGAVEVVKVLDHCARGLSTTVR